MQYSSVCSLDLREECVISYKCLLWNIDVMRFYCYECTVLLHRQRKIMFNSALTHLYLSSKGLM